MITSRCDVATLSSILLLTQFQKFSFVSPSYLRYCLSTVSPFQLLSPPHGRKDTMSGRQLNLPPSLMSLTPPMTHIQSANRSAFGTTDVGARPHCRSLRVRGLGLIDRSNPDSTELPKIIVLLHIVIRHSIVKYIHRKSGLHQTSKVRLPPPF